MVVPVGEMLIAPLSGRACVYYETRVVRAIGWALLSSDIEYEIAAEKRSTPFVVDDGTASALIDPTEAETLLGTDVDRWSHDDDADPAAESAFLARFGQGRRGLLFEKRLHFIESIIEVGERIAVTGLVLHDRDSPAPADPYRQHAEATPPRLAGTPRGPLLITNDPEFTPPVEDQVNRGADLPVHRDGSGTGNALDS